MQTTSSPSTEPCKLPYLKSRTPPALVDTFPPIWQLGYSIFIFSNTHLPFAPKSRGTVYPFGSKYVSSAPSTTPAWQVAIPDISSKFRILFIREVLKTISSNTGTLPPTSPVFPP